MGAMVILLLMGLEIAWAIAIAAGVGLWFIHQPLTQYGWVSWRETSSFILTAIPLFVFMGAILAHTGVAELLYTGVERLLGFLPGGLACATIGADGVFAAMSGSNLAAVATFGKVAYPSMERRGYDPRLSLGSIVMGGTLAPIIPPSLLLIVYGTWEQVSVVRLFAAGLIPGIMLMVLYIIVIVIWAKINPKLAPSPPRYSMKEKVSGVVKALPFGIIVLGVLGTIFGGVMTPTEAAAMGAFLSIVVSLGYRCLTLAIVKTSALDAVKITSFVMLIYVMAITLVDVLNILGITTGVADFVLGLQLPPMVVVAGFIVMYFFMGMLLDPWSMLFLTFPFVMPVIRGLALDKVWWGIIYVLIGDLAPVTPPYGMALFVLMGMYPQHSMMTIFRGVIPLMIAVFINLGLVVAFPEIVLWLPRLLLQ